MKFFSTVIAATLAIPSVLAYVPYYNQHYGPSYTDHGIVGGHDSVDGKLPWLAHLSGKRFFGFSQFCDGFFIAEDVLITAGHCTSIFPNSNIMAASNRFNQTKTTGEEGGIDFKIDAQVRHPDYNNRFGFPVNDIAIWFVDVSKNYGGKSIPIVKIQTNSKLPGQHGKLKIAGWGTLEEGGDEPEILQEAEVQIVSNKACSKKYSHGSAILPSSVICAGVPEGGIDTCQGDSGGPIFRYEGKTPVVQGIVSFGRGCARKEYPGVYTRISHYIPWIEETIAKKDYYVQSNRPSTIEEIEEEDDDPINDPDYNPDDDEDMDESPFGYSGSKSNYDDEMMDIDEEYAPARSYGAGYRYY